MKNRSFSVGTRRESGFTLIELMITVAVIGILSALAYGSYKGYLVKTRRGAAKACLMEHAQWFERYYTDNMRYDNAAMPALRCATELETFYTFASVLDAAKPREFGVTATPQAAQSDAKCGTLSINQAGDKTASGTGTDCW